MSNNPESLGSLGTHNPESLGTKKPELPGTKKPELPGTQEPEFPGTQEIIPDATGATGEPESKVDPGATGATGELELKVGKDKENINDQRSTEDDIEKDINKKLEKILNKFKDRERFIPLHPKAAIREIKRAVKKYPELRVQVDEITTTRGAGAYIEVNVLMPRLGMTLTSFQVTAEYAVDGTVRVGKPFYSREEIIYAINTALDKLLSQPPEEKLLSQPPDKPTSEVR